MRTEALWGNAVRIEGDYRRCGGPPLQLMSDRVALHICGTTPECLSLVELSAQRRLVLHEGCPWQREEHRARVAVDAPDGVERDD